MRTRNMVDNKLITLVEGQKNKDYIIKDFLNIGFIRGVLYSRGFRKGITLTLIGIEDSLIVKLYGTKMVINMEIGEQILVQKKTIRKELLHDI